MLRERLQTSTPLLVSGAITLFLPTLLAETITLSFEIPPLSVHPTDCTLVTDEFKFVSVGVDDQLCNRFARGANGKVYPGLKFLVFATCRFVDGGSGENPSSPSFTLLKCLIWTNSIPVGVWQPCRDSALNSTTQNVDGIVTFVLL